MRRPARLERAGALTPRDRMWAAIRDFGAWQMFSVAEIMLLSGQRSDTVVSYAEGLHKAGYLAKEAPRPTKRPRREFRWYRLMRDVGVDAPRVTADGAPVTQGIGGEQMWNAMRAMRGVFGPRELAIGASTESHIVELASAQKYARALAHAGYLAIARDARGGPGSERHYRFIRSRNTGPRAPLITAGKQVMDGNTGRIVCELTAARKAT